MPALATASAGKPALDGRVSTVKRMIKIFRFRIEIYGAVETVQGGWRLVAASNASSAAAQTRILSSRAGGLGQKRTPASVRYADRREVVEVVDEMRNFWSAA